MKAPIPVLRIFDEPKAKEFYLGFLGFRVSWEHRFAEGMPLYMEVIRGDCVLHLTEHHGDSVPGGRLRIGMDGLEAFVERLRLADYPMCRPGRIKEQPWGLREIEIADPFGNRLTFFSGKESTPESTS